MKIKNLILATGILFSFTTFAQKINPITKAVLDSYEKILQENPKDYNTLYQKAAQLYNLSDYDNALSSLLKAINLTPNKEPSLKQSEYALLADIYTEKKDYSNALDAINASLNIDPNNYASLYKKGNILLAVGNASEAIPVFKSMQRLKSRSQEAFFGLAKANVMLQNYAEVETLIKAAEDADRNNYITYCRIGSIYEDLGRNKDAASAYLSAFGLADDSSQPLSLLIELAKKDFNAVASILDYSIEKSSNEASLYLLKAYISNITGNYNNAYDAFSKLTSLPQGKDPSIYADYALICKNLDKLDQAEELSNLAISNDKSPENLIIKAQIDLANGKPSSALINAKKAFELGKSNEALKIMALACSELNEPDDAFNYLNEAILNDGGDPELIMLRAYVYKNLKNDEKSAETDFARAANISPTSPKEVIYKAIAKNLSGKALDANSIIDDFLKNNNSKDDLFLAAVYFAQIGNLQRAKELKQESINKGYQNVFNLNKDKTPYFNLSPIRDNEK